MGKIMYGKDFEARCTFDGDFAVAQLAKQVSAHIRGCGIPAYIVHVQSTNWLIEGKRLYVLVDLSSEQRASWESHELDTVIEIAALLVGILASCQRFIVYVTAKLKRLFKLALLGTCGFQAIFERQSHIFSVTQNSPKNKAALSSTSTRLVGFPRRLTKTTSAVSHAANSAEHGSGIPAGNLVPLAGFPLHTPSIHRHQTADLDSL
jgi:hypothetical protein